jgi:hypothetical protein
MRQGILLAAFAIGSLAHSGCALYFGHSHDDFYCDQTGCYECDDYGCWSSPGGGSGAQCTTNTQCQSGYYCGNSTTANTSTSGGSCVQGGTCATDTDCAKGFVCDSSRGSCVPQGNGDGGGHAGDTCQSDTDCNTGLICAGPSGDQKCAAPVCLAPTPAPQGCITAPACGLGTSPLYGADGCPTGNCIPNTQCTGTNQYPCAQATEAQCVTRSSGASATCGGPVYTGVNCTNAQGQTCTTPSVTCTCQSYSFNHCANKGA